MQKISLEHFKDIKSKKVKIGNLWFQSIWRAKDQKEMYDYFNKKKKP